MLKMQLFILNLIKSHSSQSVLIYFLLLACLLGFWAPVQAQTTSECQQIEVYTRQGCPHCDSAKRYLKQFRFEHPNIEISLHDIHENNNIERFQQLSKKYGVERPGVPAFLVCGDFYVGFDQQLTPYWIEQKLSLGEQEEQGKQGYSEAIKLPIWGDVIPKELGLPVFTILIGLADGFNPCAMWVLLFLLSVLVNLGNRARMALIAGSFVLISGLVYFAFMAAWLNVFILFGFSRNIQIALGGIAFIIALINIKDFFAFKKGISLGIPDSAKPGLYARVRRVVQAENLWLALPGIITVAILVNFLELLCTAGLPALYTQILTMNELSNAQYYGYLALYNAAYIFDDGLMVAVAVWSLSKMKMQEKLGRQLKLISGLFILVLAFLLLFFPDFLM